jgi:hypothetical protein
MRQKSLVVGLLVVLAFLVSGFTYAFWASDVNQAAAVPGTVTIGEGGESTVTLDFDGASTGALVPAGFDYVGPSVAVLSFSVEWVEDVANTADADGELLVALGTPTMAGLDLAQINAMFTYSITSGQGAAIEMNGSSVLVQITVTFANAPASQAIYTLVQSNTFSIPVTVTVVNLA